MRMVTVRFDGNGPAIRRDLALIALLSLPLLLCGLGNHHFWLWDEPFVAESAREMAAGAGWLVPRLNGQPFLEKPPLHYMFVATTFRLFGVSPWTARITSFAGGMLTVFATYFLGLRTVDRKAARWAAVLVPSFFQIYYLNHTCLVDASLVPIVTLGIAALAYGIGPDRRHWAPTISYGAAALAFGIKGFVGPAFILLPLAALWAAHRHRRLVEPRNQLAILVIPLSMLAWAWVLWQGGGAAWLREGMLANSLGRMTGMQNLIPRGDAASTHASPFYYYFLNAVRLAAPWSPTLVCIALPSRLCPWRAGEIEPTEDVSGGRRFLVMSLLANFSVLSVMHAKRSVYLAPRFPILACLMASEAAALCRPGSGRARWGSVFAIVQLTLACLVTLLAASLPFYLARRFQFQVPGATSWMLALSLACFSVAGGWIGLRGWRSGDPKNLYRVSWAITAISLTAVSIFVFPQLNRIKGEDAFFQRILQDASANPPPVLALDNESLTGLACLYFNSTLPAFTHDASPSVKTLSIGRFVIADGWGRSMLDKAGVQARTIRCTDAASGDPRHVCLLQIEGLG